MTSRDWDRLLAEVATDMPALDWVQPQPGKNQAVYLNVTVKLTCFAGTCDKSEDWTEITIEPNGVDYRAPPQQEVEELLATHRDDHLTFQVTHVEQTERQDYEDED